MSSKKTSAPPATAGPAKTTITVAKSTSLASKPLGSLPWFITFPAIMLTILSFIFLFSGTCNSRKKEREAKQTKELQQQARKDSIANLQKVEEAKKQEKVEENFKKWPMSGKGVATTSHPLQLWIDPALTHTRPIGKGVYVFAEFHNANEGMLYDTMPDSRETRIKWKKLIPGPYFYYPIGNNCYLKWWVDGDSALIKKMALKNIKFDE